MNPDNYDFFRPLPKESNVALNLLRSLEDRTFSHLRRNTQAKESREVFAEDELVRKRSYDEMRCEMPGQPRSTFLMVFSPDGSKVASTHGNHNIYVTDLKSGKNIKTLIGHPRTPWCIAFHPTSNQIVASGCLGGEVRIWDLSGGSEVWVAGNQSVIASIAFHPNDRILVIATYNELYFWDWSRPEPFVQVATANPKEKIRYVAFDKLGHKLITGIANSPQTRWERVRAPVPIPRQVERSSSPYRLRITPRLVNEIANAPPEPPRESLSSVPERERRITVSYRNLLGEYEQLVQRYLRVYRPPTMIDRGTDPMEAPQATSSSSTQAPETSRPAETEPEEPQPSTSRNFSSSLMMPSRIRAMTKQPPLMTSSQTQDSRKHKSSENSESLQEKRKKSNDASAGVSTSTETATQTQSPRRVLVINSDTSALSEASSSGETPERTQNVGLRVVGSKSKAPSEPGPSRSEPQPSTSREEPLNFQPFAEEIRNRFLPIIQSLPACDRPKLIRRFENSRAHERMKFRQMAHTIVKKPNRRPVIDTSSECSSSEEEQATPSTRSTAPPARSTNEPPPITNPEPEPSTSTAANPSTNISGVRNFIMELEQLLMTVLLTEIDNNDGQSTATNESAAPAPASSQPSTSSSNANSELRSSPVYMSANRDQDLIRPSAVPPGHGMFRRLIQRHENVDQAETRNGDEGAPSVNSGSRYAATRVNPTTYTRTYARRRLPSHRISAFMPTRVNYWPRASSRYRRGTSYRMGTRFSPTNFALDEIINFSERANAEGSFLPDTPPEPRPPEEPTRPSQNIALGTIVQNLESSLNDVRNIRASNRPGETSDMLSSFSESLENIMNQSDTILRNLGGTMSMLPNYAEQGEPTRTPPDAGSIPADPSRNWYMPSVHTLGRSVVESDHNYPRNLLASPGQNGQESMSPLMSSLHFTISYIQRQARLLRQQVESIERIDRAMFEVEQVQLIRQLIMEFFSLAIQNRNSGVSSVRQMMAGTRISDSSPYDSQSEEPQPGSSTAPSTSEQPRARTSGRKTYPPSRLYRMQRYNRRSLLGNFFQKRYGGRPERGARPGPSRAPPRAPPQEPPESLHNLIRRTNLSLTHLNVMARRLESLLIYQTRLITRPHFGLPVGAPNPSSANETGERYLSRRLQECVMRINRMLGEGTTNRFRSSEPVVVTADGAPRFGARHFLGSVVNGISKYIEEWGGTNINLSPVMRDHLIDSIPPPAGMNLDVERESLTSRIDQMCSQMLQNRFSSHSTQLTRSLQHMRLTMRHAYTALGQTYTARRNAMMPNRPDTNRIQLLNRYLRNINRRRLGQPEQGTSSGETNPRRETSGTNPIPSTSRDALNDNMRRMIRGLEDMRDFIRRYSGNAVDDEDGAAAPSPEVRERPPRTDPVSSNNSDDNDDESEWFIGSSASRSTNLYRTSNVNLVHNEELPTAQARTWNVPAVQVNDVPISEQPSSFHQRIMSHRQRLMERVSEFRGFPQMSVLRPRFLHPLYASVNPFDADLDDPQREATYDCDMVTTVTPNHRIQVWDISAGNIPVINNPLKNICVSECKIHNDASVDIAKDGTILVTLLPSGGYLNVTNKLGVYSLKWDTLGQCLYTTNFEQNAVSVALSPLSRHLVVGLASRRVSIVPSDRWTMARIFIIEQKNGPGERLPVLRELGQNRDSRATSYKSVNCIRWLPTSGQGLIYATNTGQLVILT